MSMSIGFYIVELDKHEDAWIGGYSYGLHDLYWRLDKVLQKHLTEEEMLILQPVDWPEDGKQLEKAKEPHSLKLALKRIRELLQSNPDEFPMSHMIVAGESSSVPEFDVEKADDFENRKLVSSASWNDEQGKKWTVSGMHRNIEHRKELKVKVLGDETDEFWVDAQHKVDIGGVTITVFSRTWFDVLQGDIDSAIAICNQAIELETRVLWAM